MFFSSKALERLLIRANLTFVCLGANKGGQVNEGPTKALKLQWSKYPKGEI